MDDNTVSRIMVVIVLIGYLIQIDGKRMVSFEMGVLVLLSVIISLIRDRDTR